MPDEPTAPTQPTIPDFKDLERYPVRPANHEQSFAADFRALVKELSRGEQPPEVPPKPLCDSKLAQPEYEKQFREHVRKLARSQR